MIQNNFIDMENMFELLDQPKDVTDQPDAPEINVNEILNFNLSYLFDARIYLSILMSIDILLHTLTLFKVFLNLLILFILFNNNISGHCG